MVARLNAWLLGTMSSLNTHHNRTQRDDHKTEDDKGGLSEHAYRGGEKGGRE